jgi:hypothetical protein
MFINMQIMKGPQQLLITLIFLTACESMGDKPDHSQLAAKDTSIPGSGVKPQPKAHFNTHLHDTTFVEGSVILFLRPNDARYAELDSTSDEIGEGDADFGVGINSTFDSLKSNTQYKDIKGLVSTNRYIKIKDCLDGPLVIDRDTVNYGFIMSAKGKSFERLYNNIRSGDYLEEIDSYFFGKGI